MELINEGFDHPLNRVFLIKAIHKKTNVCRPYKFFCVDFSLLGLIRTVACKTPEGRIQEFWKRGSYV